jgi:hypothetical protein
MMKQLQAVSCLGIDIADSAPQTLFPMEDFEVGLEQLEKQKPTPLNHNRVQYHDFIFEKS